MRHELRDVQNRPILGRGQGGVTGYDSLFLEGRSRSSIIDEEMQKIGFVLNLIFELRLNLIKLKVILIIIFLIKLNI